MSQVGIGRHTLGRRPKRGVLDPDPRTYVGLLVLFTFSAFMEKSLAVELALVLSIALLQALCGHAKMAAVFLAAYAALLGTLYFAFPHMHMAAATTLLFSFTLNRKIYLSLMVAVLMACECSVHRVAAGLYKMHMPRQIVIPAMVTLRYLPTLAHEVGRIRDAMRLRSIPRAERIEAFTVPLIMSATSTADELSRAATCRGIENPALPTDTERLRMHASDWAILAFGAIALSLVRFWGGSY